MYRYEYKTINGKKERLHRIAMEEKIGRPLKDGEHVYHIDGDSRNNDPDNLIIIFRNKKQHKTIELTK